MRLALTDWARRTPLMLCMLFALGGCGYRTEGQINRLSPGIRTIAVPAFVNQTQTYGVEQTLTSAVIREFNTRTRYRIISRTSDRADAILKGTVLNIQFSPVTYDSQSGRASSALVTVVIRVALLDRHGQTIWSNPNYTFRDQYQISGELSSFFEEDQAAVNRLAGDFARTLVSNIVEAY